MPDNERQLAMDEIHAERRAWQREAPCPYDSDSVTEEDITCRDN